jgi:excisionase family DNA binding protein
MSTDTLLTPADVARRLNVRPRTAYDYLAPGGCLHHLRISVGPRTVRVRASDLDKYIDTAQRDDASAS